MLFFLHDFKGISVAGFLLMEKHLGANSERVCTCVCSEHESSHLEIYGA